MLVPAPSESEMEQSGAQVLEWVTSPSWEDVEGALSYRAFDLTPRMLGVCVCVCHKWSSSRVPHCALG